VPGEIHRPDLLTTLPGGKAVNAARAAVRLGLPTEVVAVVAGHAGSWLEAALAQRGIPGRYVRVDGETRTCLSVHDRSSGLLTEFYEAGVTLPTERWPAVEEGLAGALADDPTGAVVLLAGSLPPGAPIDAYRRLALVARAAGARAVVDVGGEPLRAALAGAPWLAKINGDEAASVSGVAVIDTDAATTAAGRLRDLGAEYVLVTLGVDGAVLVAPDGAWQLGPPPELGPYSVGSGDAFMAGFLAALAREEDVAGALRLAAAAGAANAIIPGQGELDLTDVERLAPAVDVRIG
jgi:tagatose 6-phosphate kinase